tara:strand:+ start:1970 stop:2104 length:135 start_codon:yes stop_codon:yes gene_type:complete
LREGGGEGGQNKNCLLKETLTEVRRGAKISKNLGLAKKKDIPPL